MRLIDADNLTELCDIMADKYDGICEGVWHQFKTTVEWSPTIDAVPVVRCKDCVDRKIDVRSRSQDLWKGWITNEGEIPVQ